MTVDGEPRARVRTSGPAVPLVRRAVVDAAPGPTIAPPWQRVPGTPPRGVVALVARDGRPVTPPAPAPGVHRAPPLRARPPVVGEPEFLGLSRLARGRVGSRLFTLFFVAVFTLIAVQTLVEILHG